MRCLYPLRKLMASMARFSRWTLVMQPKGEARLCFCCFLHITAIWCFRSLPSRIPISLNLLVVMSRK